MKKLICIALTALLALCFVLSGCKQGTVVSKTDGSAAQSDSTSDNKIETAAPDTESDNDDNGKPNDNEGNGDNGDNGDENSSPDSEPVDWKNAYIDYIGENIDKTAYKYGYFILLDDDDIPEILLYPAFGAAGARLLWVDSAGEVHNEGLLAHFLEATYQEGTGKLFCNSYHSDIGGALVYEKSGDSCDRTLESTFSYSGNFSSFYENHQNGESADGATLMVNGSQVTEDEFFSMIKDEYDFTSDACKDVTSAKQFAVSIGDMAIAAYEP